MSWWNANYLYRQKLTFDNSGQSENLQDFPVLVALTSPNFDFTKAKDNGEDIRFVDSNDSTELKYEIENWDKGNEKAWIWVKVPQIDSGSLTDHIYMYYGYADATDNQDADNTWDAYYVAVYHLNNAAGDVVDSSGTGNTGTNDGATRDQTGKIDKCFSFDGLDDYITQATLLDTVPAGITIEVLFKTSNKTADGLFVHKINVLYEDRIAATCVKATTGFLAFNTEQANAGFKALVGDVDVANDAWHYVAFIWDTVNGKTIHLDGDPIHAIDADETTLMGNGTRSDFFMGASYINTCNFNGLIDEVRVSSCGRSADWRKAQNLSMTLAFITFGDIEYPVEEKFGSDSGTGTDLAVALMSTEILRPNGVGAYTNIVGENPAEGIHWTLVDEESPDGGSTQISSNNGVEPDDAKDAYELEDTAIPALSTINSVKVYFVIRGGTACYATPYLRLGEDETEGTPVAGTGSFVSHNEALARPDGGSWAVGDFDSLQVAIGLDASGEVAGIGCTQIYVEIDYTIPTQKSSSDSGTGTDAVASLAVAITKTDSSTGSDALSAFARDTITDSGTGADALATFERLLTDAGVGADASSLLATLTTRTDSGKGTDTVFEQDTRRALRLAVLTSQYRNIKTKTAQYRRLEIKPSQYRRIDVKTTK